MADFTQTSFSAIRHLEYRDLQGGGTLPPPAGGGGRQSLTYLTNWVPYRKPLSSLLGTPNCRTSSGSCPKNSKLGAYGFSGCGGLLSASHSGTGCEEGADWGSEYFLFFGTGSHGFRSQYSSSSTRSTSLLSNTQSSLQASLNNTARRSLLEYLSSSSTLLPGSWPLQDSVDQWPSSSA